MPEKAKIFFVDKNIHGAYVVYNSEGVKQYYGYTKQEVIKRYRQTGQTFINQVSINKSNTI